MNEIFDTVRDTKVESLKHVAINVNINRMLDEICRKLNCKKKFLIEETIKKLYNDMQCDKADNV